MLLGEKNAGLQVLYIIWLVKSRTKERRPHPPRLKLQLNPERTGILGMILSKDYKENEMDTWDCMPTWWESIEIQVLQYSKTGGLY